MFKYTVVIFAIIACAAAKPGVIAPLAYSAPVVAAPGVVTATSRQVIARNYNAPILAAAPIAKYVAAPVAAAPLAAKYVASPFAYSAPYAAAPLAYTSPLAASTFAYGYGSPLSYASAPLLF